MTTWLTQWGSVFVTLVVILDPPGAVPIFLAVTAPLTPRQRVAAARRASLVAFGLIAAFAVFGQQILNYLHISIAALQGSGGLLLLLIALLFLFQKQIRIVLKSGWAKWQEKTCHRIRTPDMD